MDKIQELSDKVFTVAGTGFEALVARESVEGYMYAALWLTLSIGFFVIGKSIHSEMKQNNDSELAGPMVVVTVFGFISWFAVVHSALNSMFPEATVIKTLISVVAQ